MTHVITAPCIGVKDASCATACPVSCIYSDADAAQYYINPNECIDCGVCIESCPVEAIFYDKELPARWAPFLIWNKKYFES